MPDVSLERPLPANLEAERAVLGAILLDQTAFYAAAGIFDREQFYLEAHRIIWDCMANLHAREVAIDPITVLQELRCSSRLEQAGGPAYLASLTDGLPRTCNVKHYAGIVRDQATRRRVIQLANETMIRAYQAEDPCQVVIEDLQLALLKLAVAEKKGAWMKASDLMDRAYKEIEEIASLRLDVLGMDTGLPSLNRMTQGFHDGQLIIVAGRPGHGKTSLAMNIIGNAILRRSRRVGLFTIEMTAAELAKRLLYSEAEVDSYRVGNRALTKDDWRRLGEAAGRIAATQLFVNETRVTISELRSQAHALAAEVGLDLVVIDYLQLMKGSGRWRDNRVQEVSEISNELKGLAKDLSIPVIALSQLNRAVESSNREPHLSDLRDSGSLEQDADVVLFVWREELRNKTEDNIGTAKLIVGKQRNGPLGTIDLMFTKQFTKFNEATNQTEFSYQHE